MCAKYRNDWDMDGDFTEDEVNTHKAPKFRENKAGKKKKKVIRTPIRQVNDRDITEED